jgi:hypothetical protein
MRGQKPETLVAEMKRSYDLCARLGTWLANIRTSVPLTRMLIWGRGGESGLYGEA